MTVMLFRKMTETPHANGGKSLINNLWPCDYIVVEEDEVEAAIEEGWFTSFLAAHAHDEDGNPLDAEPKKRARKAAPDPVPVVDADPAPEPQA